MMKILTALLLAICLLQPICSFSQAITLSVTNESLEKVFKEIQQQTPYRFVYTSEDMLGSGKISLSVKQVAIEKVLDLCFKDQPLDYTMDRWFILVRRRNAVTVSAVIAPKDNSLRGKVVNEKDEPLAGATITVKGTNHSVQSNAEGEFMIAEMGEKDVLLISNVGYESKEIKPLKNGFIAVRLTKAVSKLDEVQVIAYGTTTQRLNTGNVSTVKGVDIEKQPVSNVLEALEGRMAGVYIQQTSGVSGSGFNIEIRGLNSLRKFAGANNGNQPLFIVDGIPFTSSSLDVNTNIAGQIAPLVSPLNAINPSDIESVEVLKDADATAIYGSRGANGVVLISTKKGKAGKTKVDFNIYTGVGKVTRMMKLLNSQQYLEMRHEAFVNDAQTPPFYAWDLNGAWDTTRYTNWQNKLIGGNAHTDNMQVSVSGGSQNTQFLFGGNYFRQGTVFPGNFTDQKGSSHLSLTHLSENRSFSMALSVNYLVDNSNLPNSDPTNTALGLAPVAPNVYNTDGSLNWANSTWQYFTNPVAVFSQPYKGTTNNLIANAVAGYQILPELKIRTSAGYNNIQLHQTNLTPISAQNPAYNPTGIGNYANNWADSWIVEPQIEYQKIFSGSKLNILLGTTFQQNIRQDQSFFASGFTSDALLENLLAAPNIYASVFNYSKYRYNSLFGRINYNLKEKYIVNITARRDGSSRFGPGKQLANFGAAGIGWIFSNEPFLTRRMSVISFGKIRGSYGITGSDQIGDYGYLDTYVSTAYPYNGTGGLTISRLFNPDYAWETTRKAEGAIELGFFKDRVFFTSSYYRNRSTNQLVGYPLPAITGQSSLPFYNLPAIVQNTGWEFELRATAVKSKNLNWSTSFNLTIPGNKLISYPGIEKSSYVNTYEVGRSLYVQKAYHFTAVNPQTGLYQFEDVDKDGSISYPNDLQAIKEVARKYYGGILNSITYKGFKLDIFFQFVKQTGFNYLRNFQGPGTLSNQPDVVLGRWQKAGQHTDIQQYSQDYGSPAGMAYSNVQSSDKYISDASFIRLRNLSISYQFSSYYLSKLKFRDLRVYIQGQNMMTLTKYLGLDPETQSFQSIPPLKVLTAGIQISI